MIPILDIEVDNEQTLFKVTVNYRWIEKANRDLQGQSSVST